MDERGERDEPVQRPERIAFQGQSAGGYARQHNGNVYNNQHYTYGPEKKRSDETLRLDQRNKQLLKAAAAGHLPRVKHLIRLGADLDYSDDESGFTALHHAAFSGFEDTVEALVHAGADVSAQSLEKGTPLHLAALKRRLNVVKLLLDYRADSRAESKAVGHPLHCACASDASDIVVELLARGAVLHWGATVDFRVISSELYSDPPDHGVEWASVSHATALHVAAFYGSRHAFDMLLHYRTDHTRMDSWGRQAIHCFDAFVSLRITQSLGSVGSPDFSAASSPTHVLSAKKEASQSELDERRRKHIEDAKRPLRGKSTPGSTPSATVQLVQPNANATLYFREKRRPVGLRQG